MSTGKKLMIAAMAGILVTLVLGYEADDHIARLKVIGVENPSERAYKSVATGGIVSTLVVGIIVFLPSIAKGMLRGINTTSRAVQGKLDEPVKK